MGKLLNKKRKNILTTIILSTFTSVSYAGWSGKGNVEVVTSHNGVHLIDTTIADGMCGGEAGKGKFYWKAEDADAKDMLALALAAFMGGKKVAVVYNESEAECMMTNFTQASHLSIRND